MMLKQFLERAAQFGRKAAPETSLTSIQTEQLAKLRTDGYVMFDHLVGSDKLASLQSDYRRRLEQDLDFETPTLAQAKIDPVRDKDLIDNNFYGTPQQMSARGLTFSREDISSYDRAVEEFAPSTLKTYLPSDADWFDIWLDENILPVAETYMGFTPHLVEAFVRRNFPAKFSVMNHAWHRDSNHKTHLLKVFIFLSDCTVNTGPHYYIAGSIQDRRLDGKSYFSDDEVRAVYPERSNKEIVSIVPAGTIVLEDTRGLHKAGIPQQGHRDLGFATFVPPIALRTRQALYSIERQTYDKLSPAQQKYIPRENIVR